MKRTTIFSIFLAGTLLLAGCTNAQKKSDTTAAAEKMSVPVKTELIKKQKIARTIDYTATAQPFEEVNLGPSTPGRVDKIYVEVGDRVTKGQQVFLMDRTQLLTSKIQLANLEKDLARMDTLLKVGSIKQQAYDQMKSQRDVTKANVDFMEENTYMAAPFSGIVTGKYYENGELYSGAPSASGKAAVVTLMQINPLKVIVDISEQNYPLIKKGMAAKVTADVYEGRSFEGRIFRVHPTINAMSRSFETEIEVSNNDESLRPGMFLRVSIDMGEIDAFVVPASTVLLQEGTNERYIFIVNNGVAKRCVVNLGKRFDEYVEIISSGIKEGDSIVVDGQARLSDGDKVMIVK
ncbi:MAG TPA: efflux RND transporter periplasmic adaptor subunit [Bacteroidales bacterium]|nr:efflux RND transporter periplasmic adaptor subunit [Bacteroidales bacterium]HPT11967.1 efflux RND transporter periplasmic adaptor subunit [Bacteroidales bacterium]